MEIIIFILANSIHALMLLTVAFCSIHIIVVALMSILMAYLYATDDLDAIGLVGMDKKWFKKHLFCFLESVVIVIIYISLR